MSQHHSRAQDHGSGVSLVSSHDILGNMTAARLEEGILAANVAARDDTRSTNESGSDVRGNSPIKVGHDHNIELARSSDELHGAVDERVEKGLTNAQIWRL